MVLTPPLLARAPELAMLEVLRETLHTTIVSLLAAHPSLAGEPPPWWRTVAPSTCQADQLILLAYQLGDAISSYQRLVEEQLEQHAD